MTDDKNKVADKASEFAKNIWLAGIGAYGRAVDEAQDRLERAGVETPRLFKDLVKAGAALEEEARSAFSASQEARHSVEERINRVRENFRLQRSSHSDELQVLRDKVDQLSTEVSELRIIVNDMTKPARRKPAAKKTSIKKRANSKTPVKKIPARKKATKAKTPAKSRSRSRQP